VALVDLDLMQMGGRMRPATRRALVVLPEVRAQATKYHINASRHICINS
jgi:hypothetical protein